MENGEGIKRAFLYYAFLGCCDVYIYIYVTTIKKRIYEYCGPLASSILLIVLASKRLVAAEIFWRNILKASLMMPRGNW